jgi:hypothetical protein
LTKEKTVLLTEGNGAINVIMILCHKGDMDLEALASPRRPLRNPQIARIGSGLLAVLWVAFLISTAEWEQHTWYLVGIGIIGILHNVCVAGAPRRPQAWGMDLEYRETISAAKVMQALWSAEGLYPRLGLSLLPEFFPGELTTREQRLWNYARQRYSACKDEKSRMNRNSNARTWEMYPLLRPWARDDDNDILVRNT